MKVLFVASIVASLALLSVHADSNEDNSGESRSCWCNPRQNYCATNVGTNNIGCPNTNSFIQCSNTLCTALTCPVGQVWSTTLNACASCPAGQHLHPTGRFCVCDSGKTLNRATLTCDPCPSGSNILTDSCYCPRTYVVDRTQNKCSQCPVAAPSYGDDDECRCAGALFWNKATFTCQQCPGTAQLVSPRKQKYRCVCSSPTDVFDEDTVTCFTCPNNAYRTNEGCRCNMYNQVFSKVTKQCACKSGMRLNAAGTACEWNLVPVAQAAANPAAPKPSLP